MTSHINIQMLGRLMTPAFARSGEGSRRVACGGDYAAVRRRAP